MEKGKVQSHHEHSNNRREPWPRDTGNDHYENRVAKADFNISLKKVIKSAFCYERHEPYLFHRIVCRKAYGSVEPNGSWSRREIQSSETESHTEKSVTTSAPAPNSSQELSSTQCSPCHEMRVRERCEHPS